MASALVSTAKGPAPDRCGAYDLGKTPAGPWETLVGVAGFEPAASSSRTTGGAGGSGRCRCWAGWRWPPQPAVVRVRCCTSVLYSGFGGQHRGPCPRGEQRAVSAGYHLIRSCRKGDAVEQATVRGEVLPREVRAALHVSEGDEVAFVDTGHGIVVCPADQAWYWTSEWQEGEREADEQIARGELSPVFESAEEMFAHLDRQASE